MRIFSRIVVASCLGLACSPKATPPAPAGAGSGQAADPAFDTAWSALAQKGVEALYIEDDRGQGLMGNVRRGSTSIPVETAVVAAATAAANVNGPLPEQPAGDAVQKVIRQNLAAVKTCYLRMSRDGMSRSGKAIVSFQIAAEGNVAGLKVDAPSFSGTALPGCVTGQIARWSFPRSQKGGLAVSYPFVFVGG